MDVYVKVCGLWTDDEILSQMISSPLSDDEEEMNVPKPSPSVTASQAKDTVHVLPRLHGMLRKCGKQWLATILQIELVEKQFQKRYHQLCYGTFIRNSNNGGSFMYLLILFGLM